MMKAKIAFAYFSILVVLCCAVETVAQESASRDRRVGTSPAAEATVTVNEQFLNSFLTAMFDN